MRRLWWIVMMGLLSVAFAQDAKKFPVNPQTGRAVGAREISPEDLRKLINGETKSLIIDVRDPGEFARETIKGAINIPLDRLREEMKGIPKDTALFFT